MQGTDDKAAQAWFDNLTSIGQQYWLKIAARTVEQPSAADALAAYRRIREPRKRPVLRLAARANA